MYRKIHTNNLSTIPHNKDMGCIHIHRVASDILDNKCKPIVTLHNKNILHKYTNR